MELSELEARVIGCLLEKEITTPEQYPLSLNALTLACNQKSSREPVLTLSETQVQTVIDELNKKRLISEQSGFGSRVVKYKHRFCNTEFSELQLSAAEVAIVCLLLLRGAQSPGELRTRSQRLHDFSDTHAVEACLQQMIIKNPPLIQQLEREPNKRECRYIQLFTEAQMSAVTAPSLESPLGKTAHNDMTTLATDKASLAYEQRISQLEDRVTLLGSQLAELIQNLHTR
jgi:uncharacterized protein YceH (UPF0502 family)